MKSQTSGIDTSAVEVTHIDGHGIWLLVGDAEYFLSHEAFPWFRDATIAQITCVQLLQADHLRWPDLDVDLSIAILGDPAAYPLIYR